LFFPTISFAALQGVNDLLTAFGKLVSLAIPTAFGLAVLFFFYGIAKYILAAGDEKGAQEGKSIMIYGVIAIFVMSSIWGLVAFIGTALNINTSGGGNSGGIQFNGNCAPGTTPGNGC
jgi:short subunit fatty acids transporter